MIEISGATRFFPVIGWPGVISADFRAMEAL